ncbi:hypothetical protein CCZ27_09860 [Thauera sinica]|nr:hypothetical protein CCZ27_09860 [Thauera sp. K11]
MKSSVSSVAFARRRSICILHLALALLLPLVGVEAHARSPMFDGFAAAENERQRPERPAGLRESLVPRGDRDESAQRRKLSSEERSALRRDLRDAMRGAYPEDPRPRKRN